MEPVTRPLVFVCVLWNQTSGSVASTLSIDTHGNRLLFTAPPTVIKHKFLSVSVYVCDHLFPPSLLSLVIFSPRFSPELRFKRFYQRGIWENSCLLLSLFNDFSPSSSSLWFALLTLDFLTAIFPNGSEVLCVLSFVGVAENHRYML